MKTRSNPFVRISCVALFCATIIPAAAQLRWDSNTTSAGISDAAGAWNGTATSWWNGTTNVVWADNSDAQFGTGTTGNAGSVTIGTIDPTVNSITFNAPFGTGNFTITGRSINLLNASTDVTVNGGTPTISSTLAGSGKGINKKGTGELRLGGTVSYTGATTITGGTLRVNSGANSLYTNTSEFFMNGGNLVVFAAATQNIAKNFTFNSASGSITTFDNTLATSGHTLSGTMTVNSGATMAIRPRNADLVNFIVSGQITGGGNFALVANNNESVTAAVRVSNTTNNYAGSTSISGATLQLGASNVIPNASNLTMSMAGTSKPTLDLNGFSETIGSLISTAATAEIFNNSGAGTSVLSVGSNDATGSFAGVIRNNDGVATGGTVALTKLGSGTQTLTNTNTYTGATNVNAGTLVINGNISTSTLTTVASGATIGGSGTVGALTISAGGFVNPGNSPGTLNTGNYNQAGTLIAEITGLTPGTQHDQINVTGTVTLSGLLDIQASGGSYAVDNMIFLILNDGIDAVSGTFSGLAQGATAATFGGFDWIISYTANNTGIGTGTFTGGNDVALMAIPEPSAVLLSGLGVLALLRRRRR